MSQQLPPSAEWRFHLTTDSPHVAPLVGGRFRQPVQLQVLSQPAELHELLGRKPDHPVAPQTVLSLAVLAWQQMTRRQQAGNVPHGGGSGSPAGAALLTGRLAADAAGSAVPMVLAVQTEQATGLWLRSMDQSPAGSSEYQLQTIGKLLDAAADWLRTEGGYSSRPPDEAEVRFFSARPAFPLAELYGRRLPCLWQSPGKLLQTSGPPGPYGLLSGSFNPRHAGHVQLAAAASEWLGQTVHFELPVSNADKPPLDFLSLEQRCLQFDGSWLALTAAATFTAKSRLFPGTVFVVGADTAERILQPVFYGDSHANMLQELAALEALGCRFLVAARRTREQLLTLQNLDVPAELGSLFEELPAEKFQLDISSTRHRELQPCPYSFPGD